MATEPAWKRRCTEKRISQRSLLPRDWLLPASSLPPVDQLDVRAVPRTSSRLTARELEITEEDDIDVLLKRMADATFTATEVTTAFCKRATIAHQLTNCLTEILFDAALQRAKELDEHLARTGQTVGPLHGLPISLKDQIQIKGVECTMGFSSWLGQISTEDAVLVTLLRRAGAIMYVRTNVPQTLLSGETDNHVFGRTSNPFNRTLTCGGSSGGEGALIAMEGSPLGVGTDVGARGDNFLGNVLNMAQAGRSEYRASIFLSITVHLNPDDKHRSSYQGLYGLRPTSRRLPYYGLRNYLRGLEAIESVIGPMARSPRSCATFMRALLATAPHELDPSVIEMPWRESMYQLEGRREKLVFGMLRCDDVVMPHPPVQRAMRMVKQALEAAGHEVIEWEPPVSHGEMILLSSQIILGNAQDDWNAITGESSELPHELIGFIGRDDAQLTVHESWQLNIKRDEYRKAYLDGWQATASTLATRRPMDGLITPVYPHAAPPHRTFGHWHGYTAFCNLLDYPACTFPVTTVDPSLDPVDTTYDPINSLDTRHWTQYSPQLFRNAPVGLQLVGRRFQDEAVLGMVEVIAEALARDVATPPKPQLAKA